MASVISASTTSTTALNMSADTTGVLQLATGATPTTAVTIDTSQNVGIGTTSPTNFGSNFKMFAVQGTDYGVIQAISNSSSTTIEMMAAGSIGYLGTRTNHPLALRTNDTERMRIDTSGNVLVGTTSNASSAVKIMVSSTAPQMAVDGNGAGVNSLINWTTSGTTKAQTYFDATNTRFYIACNNAGGVYLASGGTSWTSASDERVKDIIEPIENATEKLGSWRAVIGKYKTDKDGTRRSFLIAQDVIQTFPEAVDATNEEELGVSYTDIIPVLVKAIQEQQTIINDLTARIETLEGAKL